MATKITRRQFLMATGVAAAALSMPVDLLARVTPAEAFVQSKKLRKFVQPLRGVGGAGIPVAQPDTVRRDWWQPGVTHYTIDIDQYRDQLHPDLPNATRLWGYGQNGHFRHLGGIIVAKRGEAVQITFRNKLPRNHIMPVDNTLMGVAGNQNNRADIHLHGGLVPWISDGGPHAWWDPNGHKGPSFINNSVLHPNAALNEAEYYYPNNQGSRLEWYHDHVFGLTRLNAYAGMASAYVIYDDYETSLVAANHLPGPLDPWTVYLVFQDKIFVRGNIQKTDPTWNSVVRNSQEGDLWYAHVYDTARWDLGPTPAGMPPDPSCVPEFFGDTMLVNGTVGPFLEVEQRQYRFRLLNACQARFLNPRLVYAKGPGFPDNAEPSANAGPAFVQIGNEAGFLAAPAMLNGPNQLALLLAPAERADLIVDFRNVPAGSRLLLYSDAPAPFPMGDPINDYYPGNPDTPSSEPGFAPNTRTLLQIRVKARKGAADPSITLPTAFAPTDPFLLQQTPGVPTEVPNDVPIRRLTLNEAFDEHGRLIQMLGTDVPDGMGMFGREYGAEPTEIVKAGSTEVWEIINLTGDTHPMHFHLANAQVLSRQPFDPDTYAGGPPSAGPAVAPDANELGWKETVRHNPGEVTRVIMKFDLPAGLPFEVPPSPRLQQFGITGAEYVWHCHILDHEEHDMMRPMVVTS